MSKQTADAILVNKIDRGIVIDHIKAGLGMKLYYHLGLDKADFTVAIITNADSTLHGKKDIIKIQNNIDLNYDMIGLIDSSATVNVIEDREVTSKVPLSLPKVVEDVIFCKNPRCITSIEKHIPHIFELHDAAKGTYQCRYCEDIVPGSSI
jgi:aspartate carbamoyltransferase regulatory subunit